MYFYLCNKAITIKSISVKSLFNSHDIYFESDEKLTFLHGQNGVGGRSHWYYGFSPRGGSMRFLRAGDRVRKNFCDPVTDEGPEYRICWHIGNFSGWRCGSTQNLNASQEWRRYVFVR